MGKGFIRGILSGAVVSVPVVAALSLVIGVPASDEQRSQRADLPESSTLGNGVPTPDTLAEVERSDISPAAQPEADDQTAAKEMAPQEVDEAVNAPGRDAPVVAGTDVSTPERPLSEAGVSIATEPAQPPTPEIDFAQSAFDEAPQPEPEPEAVAETAIEETTASESGSLEADATEDTEVASGDAIAAQVNAASEAALAAEVAATETAQGALGEADQNALDEDVQAAAIAASVAASQTAHVAETQVAATAETAAQIALELQAEQASRSASEAQAARLAEEVEAVQSQVVAEAERQSTVAEEAVRVARVAESESDAQAQRDAEIVAAAETPAPSPETAPENPEASAQMPNATLPDAQAATPPSPQAPVEVASATVPETTPARTSNAVRVNRLPTTQSPSTAEDLQADAVPEVAETALEVLPEDAPPLLRYASEFAYEGDKPLMSIVLIDDGVDLSGGPIGLEALGSFPYPITFAVQATLADAADRMAAYRADGFEVLAMIDLPDGATAVDAEVTLSSALSTLPEAVAVMEGVGNQTQTTRAAAEQVSAILSETGHGFVAQNRGLNTPQKLAARAGVPSAVVFRDFDAQGQTPTIIRRFLDQAAFRARQEGAVIMLGRLREDTISALLVWGLQDRATQVAMAPVSAVLQDTQ